MATTFRVEMLARSTSRFFNYFIIGESLIGGSDVIAPAADALIDITANVRRIRISRGRSRDLDEFSPGTGEIELDNAGRRYDPLNTDSDLYGNIEPGRELLVTAVVDGTDHPLFRGHAQRWLPDYSQRGVLTARVQVADSLATLARQRVPEIAAAHDGDLSGARIGRVLDHANVAFPSDRRNIDTGRSTFGATTFGANAAEYLQRSAQSELGALYVTNDGTLRFKERNSPPGSSQATFSDDGLVASIPYELVDQDFGLDLLYNRITGSGTTGVVKTSEDTTSQTAYEISELPARSDLLLSSDTEVQQQLDFLIARFATPEFRFRKIRVDGMRLPAARQAELFALDLTSRTTVKLQPPGGGTPSQISQPALVNGLDWDIWTDQRGTHCTATVTFQAGKRAVPFIIGDADFGVIGESPIGY